MKKILFKIWPAITIIVLWFLFCFPYIGRGLVPFPSTFLVQFFPPWNASYGMPVKNNAMPDIITQIYPWKKITIDSLRNGQIPLWNPYSFAGTVHAGNYQSAIFSPFNVLFFLFPFIDAWSIFILLQPILAGLGMFLFLRSLHRSASASVIGSVAFMFCGFMTTWMAYGTLGYAALCLPWALWFASAYMRKHSIWCLIGLSLSIATSFFAGHFQISLYVLAAILVYVMYITMTTKAWKQGAFFLLFIVIGVLFACPQILLTIDAYAASTRSTSFIQGEVIPWKYLITLFSPDFYGNPVTRNDWFGHYAEWASYVGIVPVILAIFVCLRKCRGYVRFFAILGCFSLLLAYPTPINDLLFALRLPAISTSAASRVIILFSFSIAVLSSFGLDELVRTWKEKKWKWMAIFILGWTVFLIVVWTVLLFVKPFPLEALVIAKRNLLLPTVLTMVTLCLMFIGCVKKYRLYAILIIVLVIFGIVDSYRYVSKWMPFEKKEFVYPEVRSITFLQKEIGYNRIFGNIGGEVGMMYGLPLIEGYDAMYQGRYGEFMNAVSNGTVVPGNRSVVSFGKYGIYKDQLLQLLGVRYILHRVSDGTNIWAFPVWQYKEAEMKQVYKDEQYEIFEYTKAFPRVFLASSYEVLMDKQQIINRLFASDFNRRDTLILEKNPDLEPSRGVGDVQIVKYSANVITIKTISDVNKLVFLSDVYDPGWEATIDGKKTTVYRADYDFRAIAVPKGVHSIEYRYNPIGFRRGMALSFVGIIMCIGISLWMFK